MARFRPLVDRIWPSSAESEEEERSLRTDEEKRLYEQDKKHEKTLRGWARRDEWRRRLIRPTAWLFVTVAVLTTAALGLQAADVPGSWWGETQKTTQDLVVGILGAVGVILSAILATAYTRLRDARAADRRLEELARSVGREVAHLSGVSIDFISVHVWQLRDPRVWLIPRKSRWRRRAHHLQRRAAFVPERREHEAIAFMPGRGVVGRCWARRREVVENLEPIHATATDAASYYAALDYEGRYRMSFANLWNTRQFYAIWAYPIFIGPPGALEFGGCVSVDFQRPGLHDKLRKVADNRSQELDSLLADVAGLLRVG